MRSLVWLVLLVAVACGCDLQLGPFLPSHPHACAADPDCADNQICKYPAASSRGPVCMPGSNSIYAWSPTPGPNDR